MGFTIKKATKQSARLRMALIGLSGGGKTWKSLFIARELAGPQGRVIVIDTERGSASKYADQFSFDVLELDTFEPRTYGDAIRACEGEGADVIVIDSLSHAWIGKGGALDQVDKVAKRQGGNSFGAWRDVTPQHNELVDTILRARAHVLVTMRAKMEHSQERDEKTGRTVVRKVGLAAVQRDGMEYEFDVVLDVDSEHNAIVSKTRCSALTDKVFSSRDTGELAGALRAWLTEAPAAPQADAHEGTFRALRATLEASVKDRPVEAALPALVTAWRGMGATIKTLPEDIRKGLQTVVRELAASKWGTTGEKASSWLRAALAMPANEPVPLPVKTSQSETLPDPDAIRKHYESKIKSRKHLENCAKVHGYHPWVRPVLIDQGVSILEADRSDVAITIDGWAMQGREEAA